LFFYRETERSSLMPILWILVIALIILAVAGGVAVSNFLWLVLVIALIVAVVAMLSGRSTV
jgi:fatty acid desaturase